MTLGTGENGPRPCPHLAPVSRIKKTIWKIVASRGDKNSVVYCFGSDPVQLHGLGLPVRA